MILAFDTSSYLGGVALFKDQHLLEVSTWKAFADHSAVLAENTAQILVKQQILISQLKALAVCVGPGSYTGIRVALAFAKGLLASSAIPIIAINSLELLHFQNETLAAKKVCLLDAKNEAVFAQFENMIGPAFYELKNLLIQINALDYKLSDLYFVGSGAVANKNFLLSQQIKEEKILDQSLNVIQLGKLAYKKLAANENLESGASLQALYLRDFKLQSSRS